MRDWSLLLEALPDIGVNGVWNFGTVAAAPEPGTLTLLSGAFTVTERVQAPEPVTWALLGSGLLALAWMRRARTTGKA